MLDEMLFDHVDEALSGKALTRSDILFCASMIPTSRTEAQLLIEAYCVGSKPSYWTPIYV